MRYSQIHNYVVSAVLLCSLLLVEPLYGQAYPQETDYATFDLRCEKGEFRGEDGTCNAFHVLVNQIQNRGGAIFWVDGTLGDDSNAGGAADPWKSIGTAMQPGILSPGDAVFIREGTYYESIRPQEGGVDGLPITIAAFEDDDVVISGAESITTPWIQVENADLWWTDWSESKFDFPYIRYDGQNMPTGSKLFYELSPGQFIYDDARRRDVVIADGEMLRPFYESPSGPDSVDHALTGMALIGAGMPERTFYLNQEEKRVYVRFPLGENPLEAEMQTSTKNHLFNPSDNNFDCPDLNAAVRNYIHLVGLTFEHVSNAPQQGAVCTGRVGSVFNNVTVRWTNGAGFLIVGENHQVTDVGAYDNGMSGIRGGVGAGRGCTFCTLQYSESFRNNRKGFDPFWESGGGKWQHTTNSLFQYLNFSGNYGPGLWLDINNTYNIVENSRFHGNLGANLFVESASSRNLIYNNVSTHTYTSILDPLNHLPNHDYDKWVDVLRLNSTNPVDFFGYGIQIHAGSYNLVLHNTMVSNDGGGLRIRYDERDPTIRNLYYNNIMMNFLDHDFYTNDAHKGHEIALQNYAVADRSSLLKNKGEGNNFWSHYIEGEPLTNYASFLYRLFADEGVVQLRTNNILLWRDSSKTDLTSRMVDINSPHLVDPSDWEHGWCLAEGSQFSNRAKGLPPVVDKLLNMLSPDHPPIESADVGSSLGCSELTAPEVSKSRNPDALELTMENTTRLGQNYPNPFSASTTIPYVLERPMHVQLSIFDALGREVRTLVNDVQHAGYHEIVLAAGTLFSGSYVYRLKTPEGTFTKRFAVLH